MDIEQSYWWMVRRGSGPVTDRFYLSVLPLRPHLMQYFDGVDFHRQAAMLLVGLQAVVRHHRDPEPQVTGFLHDLGKRHSQIGVPQESLPEFTELLLDTVRWSCQEIWTGELESEWETALLGAARVMAEGYGESGSLGRGGSS